MKRLEVVVLLLFVVAVVVPVGASAQMANWIRNGGFERGGFYRWTVYTPSGVSLVADDVHRGRYSAQLLFGSSLRQEWSQRPYDKALMQVGAYLKAEDCDVDVYSRIESGSGMGACLLMPNSKSLTVSSDDWVWFDWIYDVSLCSIDQGRTDWQVTLYIADPDCGGAGVLIDDVYLGSPVQSIHVNDPVLVGGLEVHQDFFSQSSPR